MERENEEEKMEVVKDRFRLCVIKTVEEEAQKHGMRASESVVAALSHLTHKFVEQLARDLEKFAQHGGRKSVNMDDVILSAHRNEEVASLLKSFSLELLKAKEQQPEKRKKKVVAKGDRMVID